MNKLAQYLNQHILGEVVVEPSVLSRYATDNGPLEAKPEMVVYPRNTQDIRKLLRFVWQLAEKGHSLPVVARGAGLNGVSATAGGGVALALAPHMNRIFEYDAKQRLVRLQPGVALETLSAALFLQGTAIDGTRDASGTVGGWLAHSGRKVTRESVDKLEVVLANGDVLQTGRVSKRELNRIKGQQGFLADIYRELDALIDDNAELIGNLSEHDASGYSAITEVKLKDGSFDLTPLFLGSDGTLGVISEMILKADFVSETRSVVVGAFATRNQARDALDDIAKIQSQKVEYYDASLVKAVKQTGKKLKDIDDNATLLVAFVDVIGDRVQARRVKKLRKIMEKHTAKVVTTDNFDTSELLAIRTIPYLTGYDATGASRLPIIDGAYVPLERFEEFAAGVADLAKKLRIELPLSGLPLENTWSLRPVINMKTVGGKQSVFKLIDQYAQLVANCGGHLAGTQSEGRVQTFAISKQQSEDVKKLYEALKKIFDPHGVLNPGAKQPVDVRELAKKVRSSYVLPDPQS